MNSGEQIGGVGSKITVLFENKTVQAVITKMGPYPNITIRVDGKKKDVQLLPENVIDFIKE